MHRLQAEHRTLEEQLLDARARGDRAHDAAGRVYERVAELERALDAKTTALAEAQDSNAHLADTVRELKAYVDETVRQEHSARDSVVVLEAECATLRRTVAAADLSRNKTNAALDGLIGAVEEAVAHQHRAGVAVEAALLDIVALTRDTDTLLPSDARHAQALVRTTLFEACAANAVATAALPDVLKRLEGVSGEMRCSDVRAAHENGAFGWGGGAS